MEANPLKKIFIIGPGLIGGSLAKAIKAHPLDVIISVYDKDRGECDKAIRYGLADTVATSIAAGSDWADLVVIAVPVQAFTSVFTEIAKGMNEHTIITDVGSTKSSVVASVIDVLGYLPTRFIPGHPIAGSERSGVDAAEVDLFENHKVILTPNKQSDSDALNAVRWVWTLAGANVQYMEVAHHDEVLAATSHLPHLMAFSLVDTLAREQDCQEIFRYAAGGFRDFTRIAASDPVMWHDICVANTAPILKQIDQFCEGVQRLRNAIATHDAEAMLGTFTRAKAAREHFSRILSGTSFATPDTHVRIVFHAEPGGTVKGNIRVPGDKSMSHRSIMLGSLAKGITEISGFLECEDSLATLQAFRDMGVVIEGPHQARVRVHGVGLNGLTAPPAPIYLGNSGTSMRLLAGLLAAQPFDSELTGDASLSQRPMERVAEPLRLMGAEIESAENGYPPLKIKGKKGLKGIQYEMPMASAQVKSCLMFAGLYAEGDTSVTEPASTRDHSERMLKGFGYEVTKEASKVSLLGGGELTATQIDVPADISSAAFFIVAAAITPNSDLVLEHVGINPTRIGVINILKLMGADITVKNEREIGGEPVADIYIKYAPLTGIDIPEDQVPLAIDEFPALFVAACCARGQTRVSGAEELRVKESDRIKAMVDGLQTLGAAIEETADGAIIQGGPLGAGEVDSQGDHRIAMAFSVASLRASGEIKINNCANVATSFPTFIELAQNVGMRITKEEAS